MHLAQLNEVTGNQLTAGTWTIGAGGTLQLDTPATISSNLGSVTLDGAGSTFSQINSLVDNRGSFAILNGRNFTATGPFDNYGTLNIGAGSTFSAPTGFTHHVGATLNGTGTLQGNFTNSGTLAPGNSPGIIHIDGDYTQTATGTLEIQVGGLTPGTEHDQVQVTGHTTLGGTITFPFINGFVPQPNDEITFLTSNSISGAPKVLTAPDLEYANSALGFVVFKNAQDLRLRFLPTADIHVSFVDNTVTTIDYGDATKWEDDAALHREPNTADKVDLSRANAPYLQRVEVTSADAAAYQFTIHDASNPITMAVNNGYTLTSAVGSVIVGQHATLELGTAGNPADTGVLRGATSKSVTVQDGGMLKGNGTISADSLYVVNGTVAPGFSVGHLDVNGSFQQSTGSTLQIDVEGKNAGQFDTVAVSDSVQVGGTLKMSISNGSTIQAGNSIQINSAGSFVPGKRYQNIQTVGSDDLFFAVDYPDMAGGASLGSGSELGSGQLAGGGLFATAYSRGDMNHDGDVNAADISYFGIALSDPDKYAQSHALNGACICDNGQAGGDLGGPEGHPDGKLTFDDISAFAARLGMSQGEFLAIMQQVPEPATNVLLFCVVPFVAFRRRQRTSPAFVARFAMLRRKPARVGSCAVAILSASLALLSLWLPESTQAASKYWDINGAAAGAGGPTPTETWNTTSHNWTTDPNGTGVPTMWVAGDLAIFSAGTDATGTFNITVSGTQSVGSVTVQEGTISQQTGTLDFGATNGVFNIAPGASWKNAGAGAGSISGTNGITKTGAGTLFLGSSESFSRASGAILAINGGIVDFTADAALGTTARPDALAIDGGTLRYSGIGAASLNSNRGIVLGNDGATIDSGSSTLTIAGIVSGDGSLSKQGTSILLLSGANTYTGPTVVQTGVLSVGSLTALGTTDVDTQVASGAELRFDGSAHSYSLDEPISIAGVGAGGGGAIVVQNSSVMEFTAPISLTGNAQVTVSNSSTVTYDNPNAFTGENFNLTLQGGTILTGGGGTIAGVIDLGTGGITKQQAGRWVLAAANTYSGATTITAGTLVAASNDALGTAVSGTTVSAGGARLPR